MLLLVAVFSLRRIHIGELNINVDETQHGVTGLFYMDLLRDMPLGDPVGYTFRYYAQYPAISPVIWPPFFHMVEAVFFLVLGPTVQSARLAVLFFSLLAAAACFEIVRRLSHSLTATLTAVLMVTLPYLLMFEYAVMLEIPALALSMTAIYFWMRYFEDAKPQWLYFFGIASGLALLTKHNCVYLAVFCAVSTLLLRKWSLLFTRHVLPAALIAAAIAAPFYLAMIYYAGSTVDLLYAGSFQAREHAFSFLTFYIEKIPAQLGWPLTLLSILGMATSPFWAPRKALPWMGSWILACYITFTLVGMKDQRYTIYWLPAFLFFAAGPLTQLYQRASLRRLALAAAAALLLFSVWRGWQYERPYVEGFEAVAQRVIREAKSGIVLYDGDIAGCFVFFMRSLDPGRNFIVLRKALYVTRIKRDVAYQELLKTPEEIRDLLQSYGIRYVVAMEDFPLEYEIQKTLREYLKTPEFRVAETFPVESNHPAWRNRKLVLYEFLQARPRTRTEVRVRMLTVGKDVVVPIRALIEH